MRTPRFRGVYVAAAGVAVGLVLSAAAMPKVAAATHGDRTEMQIRDLMRENALLLSRVERLEEKLTTLSAVQAQGGGRVVAPFEVVDRAGKMIFRVTEDIHGFVMANKAGQSVVWASALDNGGLFKTRTSTGFPEVVMGSVGTMGALVIRDGQDQDRAWLKLSNGKPVLALSNDSHVDIVSLGQGDTGGGRLALGVASGESAVLAGVTTGGKCGRVDAYPTAGAGRTKVGAPPTFILGAGKC